MRRSTSSADGPKPTPSPGDEVDLQRRRISVAAATALLGGAAMTLTRCGGGSTSGPSTSPATPPPATPPPAPAGCPSGAACGAVDTDPLHSAVITAAELAAGGALSLNIRGTQTHGHLVDLTADEVVAIRGGQRVVKTSTLNLTHTHQVTFN